MLSWNPVPMNFSKYEHFTKEGRKEAAAIRSAGMWHIQNIHTRARTLSRVRKKRFEKVLQTELRRSHPGIVAAIANMVDDFGGEISFRFPALEIDREVQGMSGISRSAVVAGVNKRGIIIVSKTKTKTFKFDALSPGALIALAADVAAIGESCETP